MQSGGGVGGESVVDPPASAGGNDQPGLAQDLEVVTEKVGLNRGLGTHVAHAARGVDAELAHHLPANRVRDRRQKLCGHFNRV